MEKNTGFIYALLAYLWWGIIPIFWKQIDHVPSMEIVAHRIIWGCVIVLLVILFMRQWSDLIEVFRDRATLLRLSIASVLVSVNWAIFIWAVNNDRIVETSLGYFINPLVTVIFGMLVFKESLRSWQIVALVMAALGVMVMIVGTGGVPVVSLSLAITFACYSVIKKQVNLPATHGLAVETLLMMVPTLIVVAYYSYQGLGNFSVTEEPITSLMLVFGGLFTLIPLLLFAAAAKRVSFTALGMTQYIGPTCQLFIAVAIYKEPFGIVKLIAFGLIWLALLVYSVDQILHKRDVRAT